MNGIFHNVNNAYYLIYIDSFLIFLVSRIFINVIKTIVCLQFVTFSVATLIYFLFNLIVFFLNILFILQIIQKIIVINRIQNFVFKCLCTVHLFI